MTPIQGKCGMENPCMEKQPVSQTRLLKAVMADNANAAGLIMERVLRLEAALFRSEPKPTSNAKDINCIQDVLEYENDTLIRTVNILDNILEELA